MNKILLLLFLLGACAPAVPPPPSPAVQALNGACSTGNLDACRQVAELEAKDRETDQKRAAANSEYWAQYSATQKAQSSAVADAYYSAGAREPTRPTYTTCQDLTVPKSTVNGVVTCTTY